MSGFQMSPKYGANNSYHICPWCGQKTGAYTSFGLLPNDEKAPETIIEGYAPCKKCAEQWSHSVPVIEIRVKQLVPGQPPIDESSGTPVYPSLRIACIEEATAHALGMTTARIGVPYLLGEDRFSELFDEILEKRLAEHLREQTDEIIEQRMAEDKAAKSKQNGKGTGKRRLFGSKRDRAE